MLARYISLRYVKLYVCTFFSMIARGIGQLARFVLLVHCVVCCVLCVVCVLCAGLNESTKVQNPRQNSYAGLTFNSST